MFKKGIILIVCFVLFFNCKNENSKAETKTLTANEIIDNSITTDSKKVLYSLRHSFATALKNNKVDCYII